MWLWSPGTGEVVQAAQRPAGTGSGAFGQPSREQIDSAPSGAVAQFLPPEPAVDAEGNAIGAWVRTGSTGATTSTTSRALRAWTPQHRSWPTSASPAPRPRDRRWRSRRRRWTAGARPRRRGASVTDAPPMARPSSTRSTVRGSTPSRSRARTMRATPRPRRAPGPGPQPRQARAGVRRRGCRRARPVGRGRLRSRRLLLQPGLRRRQRCDPSERAGGPRQPDRRELRRARRRLPRDHVPVELELARERRTVRDHEADGARHTVRRDDRAALRRQALPGQAQAGGHAARAVSRRARRAGGRRWHFRAGQTLEIRITAPERIGKVVRFQLQAGRIPRGKALCLRPAASRPAPCGR